APPIKPLSSPQLCPNPLDRSPIPITAEQDAAMSTTFYLLSPHPVQTYKRTSRTSLPTSTPLSAQLSYNLQSYAYTTSPPSPTLTPPLPPNNPSPGSKKNHETFFPFHPMAIKDTRTSKCNSIPFSTQTGGLHGHRGRFKKRHPPAHGALSTSLSIFLSYAGIHIPPFSIHGEKPTLVRVH
ncbi:hypothetical protein AMTR_s00072p00170430, partial [Amborella trichopoda]